MKLFLEESGASSGLQNLECVFFEGVGNEFQNFCWRADLKVICKITVPRGESFLS
jgi:hypothetical protein